MRREEFPMTTGVADAKTIRICQWDGEIDIFERLPGLDMVQVVEPGRRLQNTWMSTGLHLWTCPTKTPGGKKYDDYS